MGNSCAQECCDPAKEKVGEEALNLDSEHTSAYPVVKPTRQGDLPRLIGSRQALIQEESAKPSQASLFSGKPSPREDLPPEPALASSASKLASSTSKLSISMTSSPEGGNMESSTQCSVAEHTDGCKEHELQSSEPELERAPERIDSLHSCVRSAGPSVEASEDQPQPKSVGEEAVGTFIGVIEIDTECEAGSNTVAVPEIAPSVELAFEISGESKHVFLHRRPLGAEFSKAMLGGPTKVRKVQPNSYASELGIKPGWVIKRVGTEDVGKKSLAHVQTALKNALMALPVQPES
jgi:hypothetical protein